MVTGLESLARKFTQQDILHNTLQALQMELTTNFIAENADLIEKVSGNVLNSLDRFALSGETKERTTNDLVFLWTQAKLAEGLAGNLDENSISTFNVGSAVGTYLLNPETGKSELYCFASGANSEKHEDPIGTHAETTAIIALKTRLAPIYAVDKVKPEINLVVNSHGASPCGSCREEIYKHRSPNDVLVTIVNDDGNVVIRTISELFPIQFPEIDITDVPQDILRTSRNASMEYIPSDYQNPGRLSPKGVAIKYKNGQIAQGVFTGDAAFWPNFATLDAVGKIKRRSSRRQFTRGKVEQILYNRESAKIALQKISCVAFYYQETPNPYPISGIERQHLADLPDTTDIYIIVGKTGKAYKITRGELLPAAFTA